jgi:integrase/recombinase XerD
MLLHTEVFMASTQRTARRLSLADAWQGFLLDKRASGKSEHTIRNYKNTWKKLELFLEEEEETSPAEVPIEEIDRQFWVEFFSWVSESEFAPGGVVGGRAAKPLSPKTIRNYHTDFSSFYTWATRRAEIVDKHVLHTIERPEYQRPVIEPFTREEVTAMLAACEHSTTWANGRTVTERPTGPRDKAILMLLLSTGIRASELTNADRRHLDLEAGRLKVFGKSRGKRPKERFVHFGHSTQRAIWAYFAEYGELEPEDPLFPADVTGERRRMQRRSLTTLISRIGERAGVPNAYPHRFRHTFAVNYLRNGGDSLALKAVLGHTSLRMVDHYARLATEDLAAIQRTADPVDNWKL